MFGSVLRVVALAFAALAASASAAPGNIGACYSPFHTQAYPLHGERLASVDGVKAAIDNDFKQLANHFTHIRTYYAQYVGIDIAPIAAAYGIKLYLGVYLTSESWGANEVTAAVRAVKEHPETIEAIMIGSENLINFKENADTILNKVNEIKSQLGDLASKVKFGTAQRVNEYLDEKFNAETAKLAASLDILGVNIYPFFTNSYNPTDPERLLDEMWNNVAAKFPTSKLRVTETGFPTAGSNPSNAPNVQPSLENAAGYYEGLLNWAPKGAEGSTKFWFQAYDLRADDKSMGVDYETHFGFFTADGQSKKTNFPHPKDINNFVPKPDTPPADQPTDRSTEKPSNKPTDKPTETPAPTSAPPTDTPTMTPVATVPAPNESISFGDIGKDSDVPGTIGPEPSTPSPLVTSKKKKKCHAY